MHTLIVPRSHAAAITSLEILDDTHPGSITIATTGLDQRIKIWNLHIDLTRPGVEGISISKTQNVFTPVADASGLALLDQQSGETALIVCGVGLDVWQYGSRRAQESKR